MKPRPSFPPRRHGCYVQLATIKGHVMKAMAFSFTRELVPRPPSHPSIKDEGIGVKVELKAQKAVQQGRLPETLVVI